MGTSSTMPIAFMSHPVLLDTKHRPFYRGRILARPFNY